MKKKIKAVLWDMDGTLFNTKPGIEKALKETMEGLKLPVIPSEEVDNYIGPPIQLSFKKRLGMPEEKAVETAAMFRDIYRGKGYVLDCDPYEGMNSVLKSLKEDGFFLGVCTLKKQDMAERIVQKYGMEDLFDSVVGTDSLDHIKKHDTIRISCEKYGIVPDEAVLIGDTEFDPLGAEKAGSLFLGVTYGFGFKTKADVDMYENIGTAATPREVRDIVEEYNR